MMLATIRNVRNLLALCLVLGLVVVACGGDDGADDAAPGGGGTYPEGTWRMIQVGDNLEMQVILSSVWTPAFKIERPV